MTTYRVSLISACIALFWLGLLGSAAATSSSAPLPVPPIEDSSLDRSQIERLGHALAIDLDLAVRTDLKGAFSGKRCDELAKLIEQDLSKTPSRILPLYLKFVCAKTVSESSDAQAQLNLAIQSAKEPGGDFFDDSLIRVDTGFDAIAFREAEGYAQVAEYYEVAGGGRRLYDVSIVKEPNSPHQKILRFDLTGLAKRIVDVTGSSTSENGANDLYRDEPAATMLDAMAQRPDASPQIVAGWALYLSTTGGHSLVSPDVTKLLDRAATPESVYARFAKARALLFDESNVTAAAQAYGLLGALSDGGFAEPASMMAAMSEKGVGTAKSTPAATEALQVAANGLGKARAEYEIARAYLLDGTPLHDTELAYGWMERAAKDGDALAENDLGVACVDSVKPPDYKCAARWYAKAVAQGNPAAMVNLGRFYADGTEVKKDLTQARQLYERALSTGYLSAGVDLGMLYWQGLGVAKDYSRAAALFKKAADWGSPWGEYDYGLSLTNGQGVAQDLAQGVRWFRLAALQGHLDATMRLARAYEDGRGVNPDPDRAAGLYKWLVDKGQVQSMLSLATMAADGRGMKKNMEFSFELFERAAKLGNTEAMRRLGVGLFNGEFGTANHEAGLEWMRKSADAGDAEGMRNLGNFLLRYEGTKDPREALAWLERSAANGNVDALLDLGSTYEHGLGNVPVDKAKAVQWYRKGAELGAPESINNYARFLSTGDGGVTKDEKAARDLFEKAVAGGSNYAKCNLGEMLDDGVGGDPDRKRAWKLMVEAADSGNEICQLEVGYDLRYAKNYEQKFDLDRARHYLELSAAQGDELSRGLVAELNIIQNEGDIGKASAARTVLQKVADEPGVPAHIQYVMGVECMLGRGGPVDYPCARQRFLKAADAGLPVAEQMMGFLELSGIGGPQDFKQAESWFRKSLEGGHTGLRYWIGHLLLHRGQVSEAFAQLEKANSSKDLGAAYLMVRYCDEVAACPIGHASIKAMKQALASATTGQKNNLAWVLATDPLCDTIDGRYAKDLMMSMKKSDRNRSAYLDTLAAANARSGDFDGAVMAERRAIGMLPKTIKPSSKNALIARLAVYQSHHVFDSQGS